MSIGFDHHRFTDLSSLDSLRGGCELRVEPAHETDLQHDLIFFNNRVNRIALGEVQSHRFFKKDVFFVLCCQGCQRQVCGCRGCDDNGIEFSGSESILKRVELLFYTKFHGGFIANLFHRVYQGNDLPAWNMPRDCP